MSKQKKKHHGGKVSKSIRLEKTLKYLSDGKWHDGRKIRNYTDSQAVHSDASDLRKNGYIIECRYDSMTENGSKIYQYRWVK